MNYKIKNSMRYVFPALASVAFLISAGCTTNATQHEQKLDKKGTEQLEQNNAEPSAKVEKSAPAQQVAFCRQALDSLQQINPGRAGELKKNFSALVTAASQYNSVRSQVGEDTRQAVDSMYQFKTIKLCADINKELMDSLVMHGEDAYK